jgi:hypothetical protein
MSSAASPPESGENHSPSMSIVLPIVRFHCFPARAIRRNLRSLATDRGWSDGLYNEVEFAAVILDRVAPEKNEWILYISLYDAESGMKCSL